jgi:hypothetical protein
MDLLESARVEAQCFGRPISADQAEHLFGVIQDLTEERDKALRRCESLASNIKPLRFTAEMAAEDLDLFYLGKFMETETWEKRIKPIREKLLKVREATEDWEEES